jgi:hypothetical protein
MEPEVDAILEHFGTKGMKWGVRNDKGHEGQPARNREIKKVDKQYAANAQHAWILTNNRAAELTNAKLPALNAKYKKRNTKNVDLLDEYGDGIGLLGKSYVNEYHQMHLNHLKKAAKELGTNASGTKEYTIVQNPKDRYSWGVLLTDVKHADEVIGSFRVVVENGMLKEIVPEETSITANELMMDSLSLFVYDEAYLSHFDKRGNR